MASQTINGKAFEYALLLEFYNRLDEVTSVKVTKNKSFELGKGYYDGFEVDEQIKFQSAAHAAFMFLIDIESRLTNEINKDDLLELKLVSDQEGQAGDVIPFEISVGK